MDPKSSGMNESFIVPLLMAASTPKTSPPSLGDDSNTTLTFDLPPKSSPSPLQSSPPSPSPSPPPKDSPSPKALPSPSPKTLPSPSPPPSSPPYSPPPPPKDSSSQPSSNKSPPPPYKPTAPPPSNGSSSSGAGTSKKLPPSRLPWYSSLAPNNTSAPNRFSSPPPTVFSPPPISKSNRPPPPHSSAVSAGSHGKSNNSTYSSLNSSSGGGDDNSANYVGAVVAGVFIIIALVVAVVLLLIRRRRKRVQVYAAPHFMPPNSPPMTPDWHYYVQRQHGTGNASKDGIYRNGSQNLLGNPDTGPISAQIVFSYEKIMEITNGFSRQNIIGEGGFGYVYKAQLPDGRMAAVKKLKAGSGQGEREFKTEVEIISRLHHRHLVSLVGYCIEEGQRILIYEFVPNKTLDHHLHGRDMPVLDWAKRRKMAIGAAKGLAYLHEDCSQKIIHRDIKSANILLDDAFEAQVADFGLANYMAPEYAASGKLTDRSDVFSFGVVLLELVTGRKPVDQTQPLGEESLVEWARPLLIHAVETGDFGALVDPRLGHRFVESEMVRMIEAAAACIRHSAPKRPRMVQVLRALDSGDEPLDLSNGVKYGQSTVYDSGQYNEDIMRFRGVNFGSSGNSDMYSFSREMSGLQHS